VKCIIHWGLLCSYPFYIYYLVVIIIVIKNELSLLCQDLTRLNLTLVSDVTYYCSPPHTALLRLWPGLILFPLTRAYDLPRPRLELSILKILQPCFCDFLLFKNLEEQGEKGLDISLFGD
jgi:hypothetical protein